MEDRTGHQSRNSQFAFRSSQIQSTDYDGLRLVPEQTVDAG